MAKISLQIPCELCVHRQLDIIITLYAISLIFKKMRMSGGEYVTKNKRVQTRGGVKKLIFYGHL